MTSTRKSRKNKNDERNRKAYFQLVDIQYPRTGGAIVTLKARDNYNCGIAQDLLDNLLHNRFCNYDWVRHERVEDSDSQHRLVH